MLGQCRQYAAVFPRRLLPSITGNHINYTSECWKENLLVGLNLRDKFNWTISHTSHWKWGIDCKKNHEGLQLEYSRQYEGFRVVWTIYSKKRIFSLSSYREKFHTFKNINGLGGKMEETARKFPWPLVTPEQERTGKIPLYPVEILSVNMRPSKIVPIIMESKIAFWRSWIKKARSLPDDKDWNFWACRLV